MCNVPKCSIELTRMECVTWEKTLMKSSIELDRSPCVLAKVRARSNSLAGRLRARLTPPQT